LEENVTKKASGKIGNYEDTGFKQRVWELQLMKMVPLLLSRKQLTPKHLTVVFDMLYIW
jgi:hypothetical protein